ncbi:bifunctional heptose 7-phosphate kinase/heptose 1-phosphate adenyltransferase [Methanococcus maripaludis]|uniref:RfaE bifunctional protein kinase chain/domain n=1 Tax=Methanococcus maripaludis TaxID=39152 RepID=A0A7J9RXC3_METMI|nr:PfkB family carbohydrate kinase [Methanococcus maripaludis]MBB6066831.1 rfaE bifunctional protein kinase chain/domain [Methanococcus maripaludis]
MILVLGEVMLDKYTYGKVERINPEAPVPIINVVTKKYAMGGAGNVANNIASLNHPVCLISSANLNDEFGKKIAEICKNNRIKCNFMSDGRSTILKHRFVALGYNQQLLRADYEEKHAYSEELIAEIIKNFKNLKDKSDVLIISDYNKGLVSQKIINEIKKEFNGKILVDPKPENIDLYKGVYLIKPNLSEASKILGMPIINEDSNVETAGLKLVEKYESNVIITRSEKGVSVFTKDGNIEHICGKVRDVHDVSGAGDTFIATLAYAIDKGYELIDAVKLANRASSIVVSKSGTATVTLEELFGDTHE